MFGERPGRPCRCACSRIERSRTSGPILVRKGRKGRKGRKESRSISSAFHGDGPSDTCLRSSLRPLRPLRTKTALHQEREMCSARGPVATAGALVRGSNGHALPVPFLSAKDAKDAGASLSACALHGDGHSDTCLGSSLRPLRPLRKKLLYISNVIHVR